MTFDDAQAFMKSSAFEQLPAGYRAMLRRQQECALQACQVAASHVFVEPMATAAMAPSSRW